MGLSDSHHFRKMVAGACMMVAPLLLLVGLVIHPELKSNEGDQLAVVAANPDEWLIAHLLVFASVALFVPVVLGLMHMLREREVTLGHLGGGLGLLGLVALAGVVGTEFMLWQMGQSGEQAAMAAVYESVNESAGTVIPLFLATFALPLGVLMLATGLWRAHAVPSWMAAAIGIGALLVAIGFPAMSNALLIVAAAFLLVGLGSLGRMVYLESDADWEHTPEHPGFRAMPGTS